MILLFLLRLWKAPCATIRYTAFNLRRRTTIRPKIFQDAARSKCANGFWHDSRNVIVVKQKLVEIGQFSILNWWNATGKTIAIDEKVSHLRSTCIGGRQFSTEVVFSDVDNLERLRRIENGIGKASGKAIVGNIKEFQVTESTKDIGKVTSERIVGQNEKDLQRSESMKGGETLTARNDSFRTTKQTNTYRDSTPTE